MRGARVLEILPNGLGRIDLFRNLGALALLAASGQAERVVDSEFGRENGTRRARVLEGVVDRPS